MTISRFLPDSFDRSRPIAVIAGKAIYPRLTLDAMRQYELPVRLIAFEGETPLRIRNLDAGESILIPLELSGRFADMTRTQKRTMREAWFVTKYPGREPKRYSLDLPDKAAMYRRGPFQGTLRAYPLFEGQEREGADRGNTPKEVPRRK